MLLDLVFLGVLFAMIVLGALRGAVMSGAGLASLLAGYGAGILAAVAGADRVGRTLVVSPLLAPAVAGTLGFVVGWLLVSAAAEVLVAWDRQRVEDMGRSVFDRGLGAVFGMARGSLVVVLLALLVTWLDAARDLGAIDGLAALPEAEASAVAGATGRVVEGAVSSALADAGPAGELAARITARPAESLRHVQSILSDERLDQLLRDRLFWTLIQNESIDYAMNRNAIRSLVQDAEMRGRFADLGLVEEATREDSAVFRDRLAAVLAEVAPRIAELHADPELQALASDPEIIALVESGDTLALIAHPRLRRVVERVSRAL